MYREAGREENKKNFRRLRNIDYAEFSFYSLRTFTAVISTAETINKAKGRNF